MRKEVYNLLPEFTPPLHREYLQLSGEVNSQLTMQMVLDDLPPYVRPDVHADEAFTLYRKSHLIVAPCIIDFKSYFSRNEMLLLSLGNDLSIEAIVKCLKFHHDGAQEVNFSKLHFSKRSFTLIGHPRLSIFNVSDVYSEFIDDVQAVVLDPVMKEDMRFEYLKYQDFFNSSVHVVKTKMIWRELLDQRLDLFLKSYKIGKLFDHLKRNKEIALENSFFENMQEGDAFDTKIEALHKSLCEMIPKSGEYSRVGRQGFNKTDMLKDQLMSLMPFWSMNDNEPRAYDGPMKSASFWQMIKLMFGYYHYEYYKIFLKESKEVVEDHGEIKKTDEFHTVELFLMCWGVLSVSAVIYSTWFLGWSVSYLFLIYFSVESNLDVQESVITSCNMSRLTRKYSVVWVGFSIIAILVQNFFLSFEYVSRQVFSFYSDDGSYRGGLAIMIQLFEFINFCGLLYYLYVVSHPLNILIIMNICYCGSFLMFGVPVVLNCVDKMSGLFQYVGGGFCSASLNPSLAKDIEPKGKMVNEGNDIEGRHEQDPEQAIHL